MGCLQQLRDVVQVSVTDQRHELPLKQLREQDKIKTLPNYKKKGWKKCVRAYNTKKEHCGKEFLKLK